MTTVKVSSSTIDTLEHQGDKLRIRFKNGSVYEYSDVSAAEFDELRSASSVGRHFASNIRGAKAHERLPDDAVNVTTDDARLDGESPPYDTEPDNFPDDFAR